MASVQKAPQTIRSLYRHLLRELPSTCASSSARMPAKAGASGKQTLLSHPRVLQSQIRASIFPSSPTSTSTTPMPKSPISRASLSDSGSATSHFFSSTTESAPSSSPPSSTADNDGKTAEERLAEGQQYLAYVVAQRKYLSLIERYNPGMNMDEEERVRLTARRVGMDLPVDEFGVIIK